MTVALLLLLLSSLAPGQQLPYKVDGRRVWAVQPSGTTVIKTHVGKVLVTVSIHTWQARTHAGDPGSPNSYPACTGAPCSILEWMHVRVGDQPLWVGPYQLAGLADVHYLAVAGSPARLDLILMGDDAADSYDAHLIFNRQHVVERILYPGIDLTHPFEISHYYYGTIN